MISSSQPPPLLRLPREIRDIIYEYVLFHGTIAIEASVTKAPRSRIVVGGEIGFCEALYQQYKLTYPLTCRSTWAVPLHDLAVPEPELQLDSSTVHMTYQIASSTHGNTSTRIDISLFHVCKQVYYEANDIFFRKNTFSFTADFRIPTAAVFLRDMSDLSLRLPTSLELHLMDSEIETSHVDQINYSGPRELQCSYGFYPELCARLSSANMNLRKISLSIESSNLPSTDLLFPISGAIAMDNMRWKASEGTDGTIVPEWIHPLLGIKTLDKLSVFWIFDGRHIRLIGRTLTLMRQHMLKRAHHRAKEVVKPERKELEFLYRVIDPLTMRQDGAVMAYEPTDESLSYRNCTIHDDGCRLIESGTGDSTVLVNGSAERPLVREYLAYLAPLSDNAGSCTTCYCEFYGE
ncbi:hypothetical protein N0V90_004595 [Kalmusia sp. IMI 367209]|nr:hypothetical protein N0V90_004595 [Kalmusia sp. IMI 367209]